MVAGSNPFWVLGFDINMLGTRNGKLETKKIPSGPCLNKYGGINVRHMAVKEIKHILIPAHSKLSEKEKAELFDSYKITIKEMPAILKSDPAIQHLDVKEGDVIKIVRKSPTAGEYVHYRVVIS